MNSHNPFVIRAQPELNTNPIKNLLLGLALGVTRSNSGWAQPEHELFLRLEPGRSFNLAQTDEFAVLGFR